MKSVITTGKTVDEAINKGLEDLKAKREDVEVDIIEVHNKGIFGIIGAKEAKVKVTLRVNPVRIAREFLEGLLKRLSIEAAVDIKLNEVMEVNIIGRNLGNIIGRRGQTLDSIQYLLNLVVNKDTEEYIRVVLDIENYKKSREEALVSLAESIADKVVKTRRKNILKPMSPHERRIIHTALQNHEKVYTYSLGEEPYRKVVIDLK